MIYSLSMAPVVSKAFGDKSFKDSINNVINKLSIDPEISGIDVLILGPKDFVGINAVKLQTAINSKHPDVCVIYVYNKRKEEGLADVSFKVEIPAKTTAEPLKLEVNKIISDHMNITGRSKVSIDDMSRGTIAPKNVSKSMVSSNPNLGIVDNDRKEEEEEEVRTLYKDEEVGLHYYEDIIGRKVYADPSTGRELSPAEIQAHLDRKKRKEEEEAKNRGIKEEDHNDIFGRRKKKEEPTITIIEEKDTLPLEIPVQEQNPDKETEQVEPKQEQVPVVEEAPKVSVSEAMEGLTTFTDWKTFTEKLQYSEIERELLRENTSYQNAYHTLSLYENEVKNIFTDPMLTADQKVEKIIQVGQNKMSPKAVTNDILTKKVVSIIEKSAASIRKEMHKVVDQAQKVAESVSQSKEALFDQSKAIELSNEVVSAQLAVMHAQQGALSTLIQMDTTATETLKQLLHGLPTESDFVNSAIRISADVFNPPNTKSLTEAMGAVMHESDSARVFVQTATETIINTLADLIGKLNEVIDYQRSRIKLLETSRPEDMVQLTTVLKSKLRVYIGAENSGTTVSALSCTGVEARTHNTLLIDLTGDSKLTEYGVELTNLQDFMDSRLCAEFMVVTADPEVTDIKDLLRHLETRLDFYYSVNILLRDTQVDLLKEMAEDVLSITMVSNCTPRNVVKMKKVVDEIRDISNIARKLILIDPVGDVVEIVRNLTLEMLTTKVTSVPYLDSIKRAEQIGVQPITYDEVRAVFREVIS